MPEQPRISLWDWLRSNLRDNDTHERLTRMETTVATAAEQIQELSGKVDGLTAVTTDIHNDFRAFRDAMNTERENLTAAGQAALDEANAKVDQAAARLGELDTEVGDADGSDTPATPDEPAPGDPNQF